MKKVLIISYYFPPAGGSAVQRVLKFVKYLPQFGWQPIVLTARGRDYHLTDESLCSDIPEGTRVVRTPAPDPYRWYGKMEQGKGSADLAAIAADVNKKTSLLKRFSIFIRASFFIPDARIGWLPFALIKGFKLIRQEKIDLIFTTSPPFTTTLVGGILKWLSKKPWVSDYRDPWTQAYFYFPRPWLSKKWEEFLEKRTLQQADRVISINQRILDGLKSKYASWDKNKSSVLPNGFDAEDFEGLTPKKNDKFTITYTGTINTKMHPAPLLEAVKQLCSLHPEIKENLQLHFIGRISVDMRPMFETDMISDVVKITSHLPHDQCLHHMINADLLLLLIPDTPNSELIMTGKLFEYLRAGVPILCLADEGDAADLIRNTGTGFTVSARDPEKVRQLLLDCFTLWRKGKRLLGQNPIKEEIEKYDRRSITKKLTEEFEKCIRE